MEKDTSWDKMISFGFSFVVIGCEGVRSLASAKKESRQHGVGRQSFKNSSKI